MNTHPIHLCPVHPPLPLSSFPLLSLPLLLSFLPSSLSSLLSGPHHCCPCPVPVPVRFSSLVLLSLFHPLTSLSPGHWCLHPSSLVAAFVVLSLSCWHHLVCFVLVDPLLLSPCLFSMSSCFCCLSCPLLSSCSCLFFLSKKSAIL